MQQRTRAEQQQQKAKLANSYNELLKEFGSKELRSVGNYNLGRLIGKGSFGKVYLATHKLTNNSKVVLKSAHKDDENLAREIHHHRQLIHPHIARLYEVIVTETMVWLVLEYCSGDELYNYLHERGRIDNERTQKIFAQLVGAVAYVHQQNCVHRDLKLENILLDKHENVKLCDFGFTREYEKMKLLQTFCGTVCYSAPEMVKGEKYLGQAVDVWSLGIILYALLCGELPFDEDDETSTKIKILNEEPRYPDHLTEDALSLIKALLSKRPILRPSLNEILSHPYLAEHGPAQKVILATQHPPTFSTAIEKHTLERMKSAGVNIDSVIESVLAQKCDSLAGWWTLLIEKEIRKEKRRQKRRIESRRVSAASMLAAAELLSTHKEEQEQVPQSSDLGLVPVSSERRDSSPMSPASPMVPPPPEKDQLYPYPRDRSQGPGQNSALQIMSTPDLYHTQSKEILHSSSTRSHPRKLHFLTSFATLKQWLLQSAKRAASPASKQTHHRLPNGGANSSQTNFGRPGSSRHRTVALHSQLTLPRSRNGSAADLASRGRDTRSRHRESPRFNLPNNYANGAGGSHTIDRKRHSISPQPLTPHSSYNRRSSGRGMSGRKSTSSSLSSVRSFHKTHSKASSTSSNSVTSVTLKSPRSPRSSLKVLPATPAGAGTTFSSGYRVVRGNTFNESAVFNTGVSFARRKKTPFKGPNLNTGHGGSGHGHGIRRGSSNKRASTSSSAANAAGGNIIEEEEEDVEEVAEFSPVVGEGEVVVFERDESDAEEEKDEVSRRHSSILDGKRVSLPTDPHTNNFIRKHTRSYSSNN